MGRGGGSENGNFSLLYVNKMSLRSGVGGSEMPQLKDPYVIYRWPQSMKPSVVQRIKDLNQRVYLLRKWYYIIRI